MLKTLSLLLAIGLHRLVPRVGVVKLEHVNIVSGGGESEGPEGFGGEGQGHQGSWEAVQNAVPVAVGGQETSFPPNSSIHAFTKPGVLFEKRYLSEGKEILIAYTYKWKMFIFKHTGVFT